MEVYSVASVNIETSKVKFCFLEKDNSEHEYFFFSNRCPQELLHLKSVWCCHHWLEMKLCALWDCIIEEGQASVVHNIVWLYYSCTKCISGYTWTAAWFVNIFWMFFISDLLLIKLLFLLLNRVQIIGINLSEWQNEFPRPQWCLKWQNWAALSKATRSKRIFTQAFCTRAIAVLTSILIKNFLKPI